MKKLLFFLTTLLILFSARSELLSMEGKVSNDPDPCQNFEKYYSYTLKESHSYSMTKGIHMNQLTKIDQVRFQNNGFTKIHHFGITSDQYFTQTVDYVSSTNLYPEWLPYKTDNVVYNNTGYTINSTSSKDRLSRKSKDYIYSKTGHETFAYKKESLIRSTLPTQMLSTSDILNYAISSSIETIEYLFDRTEITDGDFVISLYPNGNYKIENSVEGLKLFVETSLLIVVTEKVVTNGIEKIVSKYVLNDEGILVLKEMVTSKPIISDSGHCLIHKIKKEYSNYRFCGFENGLFGMSNDESGLQDLARMVSTRSGGITSYPNPVKDILFLENIIESENQSLEVFNMNGFKTTLCPMSIGTNKISIDIDHLTTGVYFINIKSSNSSKTIKFIKI